MLIFIYFLKFNKNKIYIKTNHLILNIIKYYLVLIYI